MSAERTREQWHIDDACRAQRNFTLAEAELREAVQAARANGIPILFLADALGVSRSRIRVLARDTPNS